VSSGPNWTPPPTIPIKNKLNTIIHKSEQTNNRKKRTMIFMLHGTNVRLPDGYLILMICLPESYVKFHIIIEYKTLYPEKRYPKFLCASLAQQFVIKMS
jgi:hypothetical protein